MQERAYFDHNATTPLRAEVIAVLQEALAQVYGNASSIHHDGQRAKQGLELARRQVAKLLGVQAKEIVFLSGGTEANNLALLGTTEPGDHVITSAIEHPAVLNPCARLAATGVEVTILPVNRSGRVHPEDVRRALRPNTRLVSIMQANNETGVIQPVEEIAAIAREAGAVFHSDGVQAAGKLPITIPQTGASLYSISAHKLGAPKGIGVLYVRAGTHLTAQILGGHHERDRRAGTENVPSAIAMGAACDSLTQHGETEHAHMAQLRDHLEQGILAGTPGTTVNGDSGHRLPNTTNIRFDGIGGEAMVIALDLKGFAVSSGSACSSGAIEPSHVLLAMGLTPEQARSSIRFSLGPSNTKAQIEALIQATTQAAAHLRRVAPSYSHV